MAGDGDEEEFRIIKPLDPALRDVKYLPPKHENAPQFTLVLDLDETLIHYSGDRNDTTLHTEENESFTEE